MLTETIIKERLNNTVAAEVSSNAIAILLRKTGITPYDMAVWCGVSRPSIDAWLKGYAQPSTDNREKLLELARIVVELGLDLGKFTQETAKTNHKIYNKDRESALEGARRFMTTVHELGYRVKMEEMNVG